MEDPTCSRVKEVKRSMLVKIRAGLLLKKVNSGFFCSQDEEALEKKKESWRKERPLRAGNWAVPKSAKAKYDIDLWRNDEALDYLRTFCCDDERSEKIAFLFASTRVDLRPPIETCAMTMEVNRAAATLATSRLPSGRCGVSKPEDCRFLIPRYDFSEALRRVESRAKNKSNKSKLQRLAKLDTKTGYLSKRSQKT